jgi:electron-transferring-flavoprotein dehydrogenase
MEVDIVCVGFGPAMGGFLTTLSRNLVREDGTPGLEGRAVPGMPQVICYERADDVAFGVSGWLRGAGNPRHVPRPGSGRDSMAVRVTAKLLYLLDPGGASRRSTAQRLADRLIRACRRMLPYEAEAVCLPFIPSFLRKEGGLSSPWASSCSGPARG